MTKEQKHTDLPQVGDNVIYWRGIRTYIPSGEGKITDIGEVSGQSMAWIEGCSGCVAFTHIAKVGGK